MGFKLHFCFNEERRSSILLTRQCWEGPKLHKSEILSLSALIWQHAGAEAALEPRTVVKVSGFTGYGISWWILELTGSQ